MMPVPMQVIHSHTGMQQQSLEWRRDQFRIGFVPTMGYLHEGHASLMRLARKQCDKLVVSIYVNPTQFAPGEDLSSYPRDWDGDRSLCEREGVDLVFLPPTLYEPSHSVYVRETALSQGLCGKSRPTHFEGVATVVTKLFNIVQPHLAVFGQKDAQQARIIQKLVQDLNIPVEIVLGPIHRESDGLAMSSRNSYLSPGERVSALALSRSLRRVEALYENGERSVEILREAVQSELRASSALKVDYVELVDPVTLSNLTTLKSGALVAVAAFVGRTRLIDNTVLPPPA